MISALNSLKSYGAITGDAIARTTWKATRTRPTRPEGRETISDRTASHLANTLADSMLAIAVTAARSASF